jgi:hypothetical protein
MRRFAPLFLLAALAACATTESGLQTYSLGRGLVSYDAMVRAKSDCAAAGGEVRPKGIKGEDTAQLSNYLCYIPKKGSTQ